MIQFLQNSVMICWQCKQKNLMQDDQYNHRLRQIRTKQSRLNLKQKDNYNQLLLKNPQGIDFTSSSYRQLIGYGVPSQHRPYVWTQLLPNRSQLSAANYAYLQQQLIKNTLSTQKQADKLAHIVGHSQQRHSFSQSNNNPEAVTTSSKLAVWLQIIAQDIPRTFPQLRQLQVSSTRDNQLYSVLGCFAIYRQDIGYIQGLSLIAFLLLHELSSDYKAFVALVSLATTPSLYGFLTLNQSAISNSCNRIKEKLAIQDKQVHQRLQELQVDIKTFILSWILTLFGRVFHLDALLNMWDILLLKGAQQEAIQWLCVALIVSRKYSIKKIDSGFEIAKLLRGGLLQVQEQEWVFTFMRAMLV